MMRIQCKPGDDSVAVFSGVETHPSYQRRGTFWRFLGSRCLRGICRLGFQRIEAVTWPFNRKGIPLYKRVGFRAVPGTSLLMENYLPAISRHPDTVSYFEQYDLIRALRGSRNYGYDGALEGGRLIYRYEWRSGRDRLRVRVDGASREIVRVDRTRTAGEEGQG